MSLPTLHRGRSLLADPQAQLALLESIPIEGTAGGDFDRRLADAGQGLLRALGIDVLQVNVGKRCNQTCGHCHVDAGPDRTETMSEAVAEACLALLERASIATLDVTGGAPEMSPRFEPLVRGARALGRRVIDRCNLTILLARPYGHLVDFLAEHEVEVVCSLPHYRRSGTDRQRGDGVFEASIEALRRLNAAGYGRDPRLPLTIVTNPIGAYLPAGQASLEGEWKRELERLYGIVFDHLHTITNMPISRYLEWLQSSGNLEAYLRRLVDAFNPRTLEGLMCRTTLSVGWDGRLFDCDFNQMLDLPVETEAPTTILDLDAVTLAHLSRRPVLTGRHCFGCTAGAGSSCGGQLT